MLSILKNAIKSRQIYKGKEILIKVYITMSENHYHVISNIVGFMKSSHIEKHGRMHTGALMTVRMTQRIVHHANAKLHEVTMNHK